MSHLSCLVTSIAVSDIDVAQEGLSALIDPDGEYYPIVLRADGRQCKTKVVGMSAKGGSEPPEPLDWAHYLCTYSRYIYLNVWKYRCSVRRVREEIIPMLEKAQALIAALQQEGGYGKGDKSDLAHYRDNIDLRIKNLKAYV